MSTQTQDVSPNKYNKYLLASSANKPSMNGTLGTRNILAKLSTVKTGTRNSIEAGSRTAKPKAKKKVESVDLKMTGKFLAGMAQISGTDSVDK